ncbi:MAG: tRNA uridine-5-carboxymethylaminomethyl(34) synthesis GTPase MnmE [Oscillospiraceae bacterium]|nr:tRNA uridine-5-carboxymethylaminomethyl(34) synthesis GTPase MnmE [Oscillospiraceae bacterium]
MSDVIAAIATAATPAGIGVIRLSGDTVFEVGERIFRAKSKKRISDAAGYTALYGWVYDDQGDIDECIALIFKAPRSYTGENVIELSCHGGLYVLQRALRAAISAGARPAEPGEFTKRAFINGKIDLTRAEAVMDLINANNRLAAKTALASSEGALFRRMQKIKHDLTVAAAGLSAYVDYPDDDIPEVEPKSLDNVLANAQSQLSDLLDNFESGRIMREGIDTVIVGTPNVGKSTLMNLLAGCERSIVTPIPGTTRDIVEETIRLGDVVLRLADTAGQRITADDVENIGVQRARERMDRASLVLIVFDGSQALTEDDLKLAEVASKQTAIAVINKSDKPQIINDEYIRRLFKHVVIISAQKVKGIDDLKKALNEVTGLSVLSGDQLLLSTERQRDCARRCLENVDKARDALSAGITLDAVGVCIDSAISALLEMTGERVTETVVDEVFSRFCVGK